MAMRAIVVFHGFGQSPLARLFGRPGFRHCFVCIAHQDAWLRLDFQAGLPTMEVVCQESFDLAKFYAAAGLTVVAVERTPRTPRLPFMLATCVGATKRMLGIRAPLVLTPHQLYQRLKAAGE